MEPSVRGQWKRNVFFSLSPSKKIPRNNVGIYKNIANNIFFVDSVIAAVAIYCLNLQVHNIPTDKLHEYLWIIHDDVANVL